MQQVDSSESVTYNAYASNNPSVTYRRSAGVAAPPVAPVRQEHYGGPIAYLSAHPHQPVQMRMQPHYVEPVYLSQSYMVDPAMPSVSHQYDGQIYDQTSYGQSAYIHTSPLTYGQHGSIVEPSTQYPIYQTSAPYYEPNSTVTQHAQPTRSTLMN